MTHYTKENSIPAYSDCKGSHIFQPTAKRNSLLLEGKNITLLVKEKKQTVVLEQCKFHLTGSQKMPFVLNFLFIVCLYWCLWQGASYMAGEFWMVPEASGHFQLVLGGSGWFQMVLEPLWNHPPVGHSRACWCLCENMFKKGENASQAVRGEDKSVRSSPVRSQVREWGQERGCRCLSSLPHDLWRPHATAGPAESNAEAVPQDPFHAPEVGQACALSHMLQKDGSDPEEICE